MCVFIHVLDERIHMCNYFWTHKFKNGRGLKKLRIEANLLLYNQVHLELVPSTKGGSNGVLFSLGSEMVCIKFSDIGMTAEIIFFKPFGNIISVLKVVTYNLVHFMYVSCTLLAYKRKGVMIGQVETRLFSIWTINECKCNLFVRTSIIDLKYLGMKCYPKPF